MEGNRAPPAADGARPRERDRDHARRHARRGHHHYLQIVDRLLDARSIVDADLTDVTAGELVALVARYLAHQEAIDVRIKVAPPLDDQRWMQIQAGPDGQLYDVAAAGKLCRRMIETRPPWRTGS